MKDTLAMLLAGGVGSRLNILSYWRAKPAVPFGGIYRIIDFTMSNVSNSGIENVAVLTQYKPRSLMRHINTGEPWDFIGRTRGAKILPPSQGRKNYDWYRGTADAIRQNIDYIKDYDPKQVIILSGDHIYNMDYSKMIKFHKDKNADVTVAMLIVEDMEEAKGFGIGITNKDMEIIDWEEKPEKPRNNLASMGVYLFNTDFLLHVLNNVIGDDFGMDIIPFILANPEFKMFAYPFDGYWRDVGTLRAYWDANMDLLNPNSGLNLEKWNVMTYAQESGFSGDRPPGFIGPQANVTESVISPGCEIHGTVHRSILAPGVCVEKGAQVRDSVLLHDSVVGENSVLNEVIADKNTLVGDGCKIGMGKGTTINKEFPKHVNTGLVIIGKLATIPAGTTIGRNCIIFPNVDGKNFSAKIIKDGETIKAPDSIEKGGLLFT